MPQRNTMLSQENMWIFTKTPNFAVHFARVIWVCPPRSYSGTCQYPTQKDKFLKSIETVAQRCSVKKVFLEISQNSPENTCARVSILIKLQASGPEEICEICEIFENTFYYRTSPVAASKSHRRGLSNFVSMPRLCTIQNTSNSLAKAHLRIRFSQNSSQWLLSNVSYFFKKGKNRNNFSYLLWP